MAEDMPERVPKECQKRCQNECQKECQAACQKELQQTCQREWQKLCHKKCQKVCLKICHRRERQKIRQKECQEDLTSTASSGRQCSPPDLNRQLRTAVFPAGPQPPVPDGSVPRRTSTASQKIRHIERQKNVRKKLRRYAR